MTLSYGKKTASNHAAKKYQEYYKTDKWENIRQKKKDHEDNKCEICGGRGQHVIHVTYNAKLGQEGMNDIVLLCNKHNNGFQAFLKSPATRKKTMNTRKDNYYWYKQIVTKAIRRDNPQFTTIPHNSPQTIQSTAINITINKTEETKKTKLFHSNKYLKKAARRYKEAQDQDYLNSLDLLL